MHPKKFFSQVDTADHLPALTVSQEDVDLAFGDPAKGRSIMFYVDSDWSRKFEEFYRQHFVHVRDTNVLLIRFAYPYEVILTGYAPRVICSPGHGTLSINPGWDRSAPKCLSMPSQQSKDSMSSYEPASRLTKHAQTKKCSLWNNVSSAVRVGFRRV
jgi:hypothetical protein